MKELIDALKENGYSGKEKLEETEITVSNLSFVKLRDKLYSMGEIIEEKKEEKIYVAEIKASKFGDAALVAMKLHGNKLSLCGFCDMGLLNTKTMQKVFSKIECALIETQPIKTKSYKKPIVLSIIGVLVVIICVILFLGIGIMNATNEYNLAVEKFNITVKEYNDLTKKGQFDYISDMPKKMEELKPQDSSYLSALGIVFSPNNKEKIDKDISTVKTMTEENRSIISIAKQIIYPKEDFVKNRISKVKEIKNIEAVTKKNDPNGLLNKKGGYKSCLYFTTTLLDNKKVKGNSIVSKGTDGGGAVEVFETLKDAKNRCEYLASFDGTMLTTGSYALVGTMVIRISYRLDETEQYKITDSIIKALTKG